MSITTAEAREPMSFEAFFAFVDARPDTERWELVDGQPVMMAGGTSAHAVIGLNIAAALLPLARRRGCQTYAGDFFASGGEFSGFLAVPHVFVRCGQLNDGVRKADDPVVVVEVLSPSTIRHDRGRKFDRYAAIVSLKQIIFAYQDETRVESFVRDGEDWPMAVHRRLDESVVVPTLGASLILADIYAGTELASG